MSGERIIPLTVKDKRKLRRALRSALLRFFAQIGAALFLLLGLAFFQDHVYNRFFLGAALVLFTGVLIFQFMKDKSEGTVVRILRDWKTGKKRVIQGRIERVEFIEKEEGVSDQIYQIGPYRFFLHHISPLLKRFRQVMPGQMVEVHQCLHSGLVLKISIEGE